MIFAATGENERQDTVRMTQNRKRKAMSRMIPGSEIRPMMRRSSPGLARMMK